MSPKPTVKKVVPAKYTASMKSCTPERWSRSPSQMSPQPYMNSTIHTTSRPSSEIGPNTDRNDSRWSSSSMRRPTLAHAVQLRR